MQAASPLKSYFPLISQCAPENQKTAAKRLEGELKGIFPLIEFFGARFVINCRGEAAFQTFEQEAAKVGSFFERMIPEEPTGDVLNKHWHHARKATAQDPALFEEQIRIEVKQILGFLQVIKKVKKCLIEACEALSEAQIKRDVKAENDAKLRVSTFSQPVIVQDDARFGIVSPDRQKVSQETLTPLFLTAIRELPQEWDGLALEAWAKEMPPSDSGKWSHLRRLGRFLQCSGLVINFTMLEPIENELSRFFQEGSGPLDTVIGQMARTHRFYAIFPSLVYRVHSQELRQAQPILSPIDIQRNAATARLFLSKAETDPCDWEKLFGSRFAIVPESKMEICKAICSIVQDAKLQWEQALSDYLAAQDVRIAKRTADEAANKAYEEAENRRRGASSLFFQFGEEPLPIEDFERPLSERKQALERFYETLLNLPKDWEFVWFEGPSMKPQVNALPDKGSLTTMRALAVNYIGYEKLLSVLANP